MSGYEVGDELLVTILPLVHGEEFQPVKLPNGQSGKISQRGRKFFDVGEQIAAWVYSNDESILIAVSTFGRYPISAKMQPRYKAGLQAGIQPLEVGTSPDADGLSALTGMYSRSWRKDQADWLTVWKLLGKPGSNDGRKIGELFRWAAREIRGGQVPREPLEGLKIFNLLQPLKAALTELGGQGWIPLELHSRAERTPTFPNDDAQPSMIMSEYSKQKLDRANSEHAGTQRCSQHG